MSVANYVIGAVKGKGSTGGLSGPLNMLKRIGVICRRYGVTPRKMDKALARLAELLDEYQGNVTLPVPAAVLTRNPKVLAKYQRRNVELAVHGYKHDDHTQHSSEYLARSLAEARRLHRAHGLPAQGFRCPYLRWNEATIAALRASGYLYDGSQALAWDVVGDHETEAYRHVLSFYGAASANDYPAVPRWDNGLVRIPYCLPDDEALVDRLHLRAGVAMNRIWLAILTRTYELGELFTLGLHPERTFACEASLVETLRAARKLSPEVWIARLEEIARWWIARTQSVVTIADDGSGEFRIDVDGPDGVIILARGVELLTPAMQWDDTYRRAAGTRIRLRADRRPFIGLVPTSSPALASFLRQQGYIVEPTDDERACSLYLDQPTFDRQDERALLARIEKQATSLVRLGRWPNGARSALCVTGDIDALTIWDYGLRLFGR